MTTNVILGLAIACLGLGYIGMALLFIWQQKRIGNLEKKVQAIENDRAENKGSVLYTRPIHIVPGDSYGAPISRRERRERGEMGGK